MQNTFWYCICSYIARIVKQINKGIQYIYPHLKEKNTHWHRLKTIKVFYWAVNSKKVTEQIILWKSKKSWKSVIWNCEKEMFSKYTTCENEIALIRDLPLGF